MTTGSGKFDKYLSIAQQIAEQQKLEGEAKEHFVPVGIPIVAKAHTPVYNMHRFFARRPFKTIRGERFTMAIIKCINDPEVVPLSNV